MDVDIFLHDCLPKHHGRCRVPLRCRSEELFKVKRAVAQILAIACYLFRLGMHDGKHGSLVQAFGPDDVERESAPHSSVCLSGAAGLRYVGNEQTD